MNNRPRPRTPDERAAVFAATKARVEAAQRADAERQKFEASLRDQVAKATTPEEQRAAATALTAYVDERRARAKANAAAWGGAHLVK